jgi:D-lactate dehydrogenase (cytochrome)
MPQSFFRGLSPRRPVTPGDCRTRAARGADSGADVVRDPDTIAGHLEDAAHYGGGHAAGIACPRTEADVGRLVRGATRILPIGAQSSLTGGATPFGDLVLSTARLSRVADAGASRITVGAGVTLDGIQAALRPFGAVYPPVPTFTGATAGGTVATNAAGAATFKYGSTRDWVEGLTVVLANGEVLDLVRGQAREHDGAFTIHGAKSTIRVPVPSYRLPEVAKHSAGYFAAAGMDLVDLFVGSEGTLGIVTEVTFRALSPAPAVALALVFCGSEASALQLVADLRQASIETRRDRDPRGIDACAIEYMDDRSLRLLKEHGDLARLHVQVPGDAGVALLVQLELPGHTTAAAAYDEVQAALQPDAPDTPLVRFCRTLDRYGLLDATELAAPGDLPRQAELLRFRESVPAEVNRRVGLAKLETDARIEKTAADMIVPFARFGEMLTLYRKGFEGRGLDFAIWGHVSDGNVHPNVLPRTYDDVLRGRTAIVEFGREVARLGGSPLAEHGVGRNPVKQALLRQLYGEEGIGQMRAVKRALDPDWKLAPGVIFPE